MIFWQRIAVKSQHVHSNITFDPACGSMAWIYRLVFVVCTFAVYLSIFFDRRGTLYLGSGGATDPCDIA